MTILSPDNLPIFKRWPTLRGRLPWTPIGAWPTPAVHARAFGARIGAPAFYVKREDLSHAIVGGNKPRGLEFLVAEALRRGARTVLTASAVGSHHVARTAWHMRRAGIETIAVVVDQPVASYVRANLLLGLRSGARYVPAHYATLLPTAVREYVRARRPYVVMPGGTMARSCVGHVSAALELKAQIDAGLLPEPDFIYVPMGSLGTAAGLVLGLKLAGLRSRVVGVAVSYRWYCTRGRTIRLAKRTLSFLRRCDPSIPRVTLAPSDVEIVTDALGPGYAWFTPEAAELSGALNETERLLVDGTYTGKTLDGAARYIEQASAQSRVHLFWHTYHPLPTTVPTDEDFARLHPRLHRYLSEPPQPLDERFPGGSSAGPSLLETDG